MKQQATMDMTNGPVLGNLLLFALPLMASNLLQLLFNAADVVVVGRFAGHESLAAVGSTASIIFLFTNLLIGISVGVNVVISRYLGQGDRETEISRALHTSLLVALVGGVALGAAGILAADWMLTMVSTPADIYGKTLLYLQIYFVGTPFVMLYNYGAAALRATGDTRRPLLYLLISGILNLALNLLFVIVFSMDVAGVGLATIISQLLSAVLILRCLSKSPGSLHFSWKELRMDWGSFRSMAYVGVPAGIQSCLFSLSNVIIQGAINSYGSIVIAGSNAASSIESFIYTTMNSFHQASQTFISQNIGAGRYDRISRIFRLCMICTVVLGAAESAMVVGWSQQLLSLYNTDPAVIAAGVERLWVMTMPYIIFGMADVLIGSIRGYGIPIVPVIINLIGTCLCRIVWIGLLDTSQCDVRYVYLSYPVTWTILLVALGAFWVYLRRKNVRTALELDEEKVESPCR